MAKKPDSRKPVTKTRRDGALMRAAVGLALAVLTICAFSQVVHNDFVRFDDFTYIRSNPHVQMGLTPEALKWAFNVGYAANWHPLTWISHMIDVKLFGMDAGKHHLMGLLIHTMSVVLLYLALLRMTGSIWRSAFVAALFAIHPLHVESVAWAAERKDVLSTFFMMLTLLAYAWYAGKPSVLRYLTAIAAFALGLLSKPMLVTLPFVLLMLDWWPLARYKTQEWSRLVLEKAPFLVLALVSSVFTFIAQQSGGAVQDFEKYSVVIRIANALVTYVTYLGKMFWPAHLGIPYPHPGSHLPMWQAFAAGVLMVGITVVMLKSCRERPCLSVGWLWYVVTLVPVIGFVQVGGQAMADRYTYVPLIGVFIAIAWAVPEILGRAVKPAHLAIPAIVAIFALSAVTYAQVGYWKDTVPLFLHTIAVTGDNAGAENNLAATLQERGHSDEAVPHLERAIKIDPTYAQARGNLGNALVDLGQYSAAIERYHEAIKLDPKNSGWHASLGRALVMVGDTGGALAECRLALDLDPNNPDAHNNNGLALAAVGRIPDAVQEFKTAVTLNPEMAEGQHNIGYAYAVKGRFSEAIPYYRKAIEVKPTFGPAHSHLAEALYQEGDYRGAWNELDEAVRCGERANPQLIEQLSSKMPRTQP